MSAPNSPKLPFASLVSEAMARRNLGLRALCRAVGLDPSFFSKVLSGKRSPPAEEPVLRRIAAVLELDPVRLILSTGRLPSEMHSLWEQASSPAGKEDVSQERFLTAGTERSASRSALPAAAKKRPLRVSLPSAPIAELRPRPQLSEELL